LYEQTEEASKYGRLAIQIREKEATLLEKPNGTNHERDLLSLAYLNLGSAYAEELNDASTAERFYDRALSVAQSLVAEHPDYRLGWIRFAAANRQIGELQYREANYRSALDHFQTGLGAVRDATAKLTDAQMRGAEPSYMLHVAESLYRTGQVEQARKMLREAGEVNAQINGFGGTETSNAVTEARFLGLSAEVYEVFGQTDKALAAYAEAEALWKKVVEVQPQQQTEASLQIARLCLGRGDLYAGLRVRTGEARSEYERVVEILSKLKASNQISLGGLNELNQAKQKLQAL
jgi:tetratricopeptide (TPR) repeat protein